MRKRGSWRSTVLIVCALGMALGSVRPGAQDLWYRSYLDGVSAYQKGDYPGAQRNLLAALNNRLAPDARGRSVLYYGQYRSEFIPEYFLALVSFKLGRYDEAVAYQRKAEAYLKSTDREYVALIAAKAAADKSRVPTQPLVADNSASVPPKIAEASPAPPSVPSRGTPPPADIPVARPPSPPPATTRSEFDRLLADASTAVAGRRYEEARQAATRARDLGVDSKRADEALRGIEIQELRAQIGDRLAGSAVSTATPLIDRLAAIDPANPLIRSARDTMARRQKEEDAVRLERTGLSAFYRGNYQQALDDLGKIASDARTSRTLFYQACSTAAIALLEGDKGKPRLQQAQDLFRRSRPQQNRFVVDRKYISPSIIKALEAGRTG